MRAIYEAWLLSDFFGRLILVVLFAMSVFVWAVILRKYLIFREAKIKSDLFRQEYRKYSSNPLGIIESNQFYDESPFYSVCDTVLDNLLVIFRRRGAIEESPDNKDEKIKLNNRQADVSRDELETLSKAVDSTISNEVLGLEKNLNLLATTASISPLLGLLGTVWGILIGFQNIARQGSAQIAVVTEGISVALVTTVVGLVVAMPSLVMYNYMVNIIKRFEAEMENFSNEIIVDIERKYMKKG
jgi:biopolymer transport protein TolQ